VALESDRAGAVIVGEDLGTVEDEVREQLTARGVLSYRLVWFEDEPPEAFPIQALAAVTTHDLPTVAGVWSGTDEQADAELRGRLVQLTALPPSAPLDEVAVAVHAQLAAAPSMVVTATLDDALLVEERPNLPGTTIERPNWALALPRSIEEMREDRVVNQIAEALQRQGT
jgi:4-alpha-glucanotransferase